MHTRDLLANQVTYLKFLLASPPEQMSAENLRPTYLTLQQLQGAPLPYPALDSLRRLRQTLETWLKEPSFVGIGAVQDVLKTLGEALTVLGPSTPPHYA
jgi:hypothetical protein